MASETFYWHGADEDGDYQNAVGNNWVKASDGQVAGAGVYPGAGAGDTDSIVLPAWAAGDLTANLDNSDSAGVVVNITVQSGFKYAVGTARNPLYVKQHTSGTWTFDSADAGDMYLMSGTGTVAAVYVNQTNSGDDALHLAFVTNPAASVYVVSGNLTLDAALFFTASAGVDTLLVFGQTNRPAPVVNLRAPVTTNLLAQAGTVYWESGTITQATIQGGVVTAERSLAGPTLTDATYYAGSLLLRTAGADLTITNPISVKGDVWAAGNFNANIGQAVSFA